jgi:hypothetical protein
LNQTLAAISKIGSDLIFGPFGPTTAFLAGSSKPKPVPGELLREPIVLAIAPYLVGLNDEIRETRCD